MMYSEFTQHVINFLKQENLIDKNYELQEKTQDHEIKREFQHINLYPISMFSYFIFKLNRNGVLNKRSHELYDGFLEYSIKNKLQF